MPAPSFHLTTLGCRVNHAETRDLESVLRSRGLRRADTPDLADLHVVHSCSVTRAAAAKSRQAVRRSVRAAGRTKPPHVIVTGCYPSTNPVEATGLLNGRGRVLPHDTNRGEDLIARFAHAVDVWLQRTPVSSAASSAPVGSIVPLPMVPPSPGAGAHVRAELKIQDGCDAHCTFCIIPSIRRRLRSKTIRDAVDEARRLVDLGHREIVLTGIFIGAYGHETALRRKQANRTGHPLADLIDEVSQVSGLLRLRVSSMEPGDVNEHLLDAMMAAAPVVVPHLHLPLQSGSDAVLARMNRQYRIGQYLEMIDMVNRALTSEDGLPPAITTDVICGFPGETEEDFERTATVARQVGFLHMHVFPYSPRDGTAAARWRSSFVPEAVRKDRVRRLIALEDDPDDGLSIRYRRRLIDRTVRVILEQPLPGAPSVMTGRCDHYAIIEVPTDRPRGELVHVHVADVGPDRVSGHIQAPDRIALRLLTAS